MGVVVRLPGALECRRRSAASAAACVRHPAVRGHRNPTRHPDTAEASPAGLTQWWSEKQCTNFFRIDLYSGHTIGLRPDGYGCWEQDGRAVRFFLEYDTGTEALKVVTAKLADYHSLRSR